MRFPFFRNRDSVKNGILISIRRTGDGFHPGLFTDSFDDTYYDVTAYINSYPSDSVQRKILSMYFYQDKSDAQIARKLKLSRQYVNRMKKKLILKYISENK